MTPLLLLALISAPSDASKTFETTGWLRIKDLAASRDGRAVIIGDFTGGEIELRKLHPSGAEAWTQRWGGSALAAVWSIAIDRRGEIFLAGFVERGKLEIPGGPTHHTKNHGFFSARLNADGKHVWSRVWSPADGRADAKAIAVDRDGNVYVAGDLDGTFNWAANQTLNGRDDVFLLKLAGSDGAVQWARRWGGERNEAVTSLAIAGDGVVLAGRADRDPNTATAVDDRGNVLLLGEFSSTTQLEDRKIIWGARGCWGEPGLFDLEDRSRKSEVAGPLGDLLDPPPLLTPLDT